MLIHLDIRDLAVVASLNLSFRSGLSVLTGETGAGKSILLTALGLALGGRADSAIIRPGAQKAEINLTFDLNDCPQALAWLDEQALADGDECLVRRVIAADGRSRAFVNGSPVTLQSLQELGQWLVEIHGQHAHVQLIKSIEQRRILDAASSNGELLAQVDAVYRRWRRLTDELARLTAHASDREARLDLLQFQVEELEQQDIASLNYADLVEAHTRQANVDRILDVGQAQLNSLYEDETHSVGARLAQAVHALSDLARLAPEFEETVSLLDEAQLQVKEASLQLRRELERQEVDPSGFAMLEQRLADVHRLARKHQVRPEVLPEQFAALQGELASMQGGVESVESLQRELEQVRDDYRQLATKLSERRQSCARQLEAKISGIIRELGMPQGEFLISVQSDADREPAAFGQDVVEFLVSANPGIPPRALARVASGGELSRISLAIQVAATEGKSVPTLVFDEVDSGIGGGIAEVVGQKLRLLGSDRQIFCVTHLPQVSVQGHHHMLVEKVTEGESTQSRVRGIEGAERTAEIARMLGGVVMTEQTLAHASEMLAMAAGTE